MTTPRGTVLLLAVALAATAAGCGRGEPAVLRFDGLYRAGPSVSAHTTYWRYLRFFEDGTVVSASSTGDTGQVATWLRKPYELSGRWTREDDTLRFTCKGVGGSIDYEGEVLDDGLALAFHSHINDKRGDATYEFVALEERNEGP